MPTDENNIKEAARCFWKIIENQGVHPVFEQVMKEWEDPQLKEPEEALDLLCRKTYPSHSCINQVIVKIGAINQVYATRVRTIDTYSLASLITRNSKELDEKIQGGDPEAVILIADSGKSAGMNNHYSFATKYCSFHKPESFPIYDSYLDAFVQVAKEKGVVKRNIGYRYFNQYGDYRICIDKIRDHFGLAGKSYKVFDQFLWLGIKDCDSSKQNPEKL